MTINEELTHTERACTEKAEAVRMAQAALRRAQEALDDAMEDSRTAQAAFVKLQGRARRAEREREAVA